MQSHWRWDWHLSSPVSIQTQSLALRALRKRKPQETQALALFSRNKRKRQPIGILGRSSGNHDWLLANASACVRLRFLRFSFTQRTQRKRLRLNGNRASNVLIDCHAVTRPATYCAIKLLCSLSMPKCWRSSLTYIHTVHTYSIYTHLLLFGSHKLDKDSHTNNNQTLQAQHTVE